MVHYGELHAIHHAVAQAILLQRPTKFCIIIPVATLAQLARASLS